METRNKSLNVGIIGPYLSSSGTVTHVRTLVHGFHNIPEINPVLITYMEPNSVVSLLKAPKIITSSTNEISTEIALPAISPTSSKDPIEKHVPLPVYVFDSVINPATFNDFSELIKQAIVNESLEVLMPQIKPFVLFCTVLAAKKLRYESTTQAIPQIIGVWHSNFGWIKDATYHLTLARMSRPYIHAMIPVSENVKNDLKQHLQLSEDQILEIIPPGGIDIQTIQKDRKSLRINLLNKFGIENEYIAFLGRHLYNKGVDVLLAAFKEVKNTLPELSLVIMGSGPFTDEYKKIKENLNIKDVVFTGYLTDDEVYALLQGASLFCLPSRWESFSISVLEAMAAGCPVICTNVGGIPFWVGDSARLIPPDDPKTLAANIIDILTNETLQKELKDKSIAKATEYDWMNLARKTHEQVKTAMKMPSSTTWDDDQVNQFSDHHFDLKTGLITTPRTELLINDQALFFPSEALESNNYFKIRTIKN